MAPKKSPLKLDKLQLKTPTIMQICAETEHATSDGNGEITVTGPPPRGAAGR